MLGRLSFPAVRFRTPHWAPARGFEVNQDEINLTPEKFHAFAQTTHLPSAWRLFTLPGTGHMMLNEARKAVTAIIRKSAV